MKLKKQLLSQIQQIILEARSRAVNSAIQERVLMYGRISKVIFEEERGVRHLRSFLKGRDSRPRQAEPTLPKLCSSSR